MSVCSRLSSIYTYTSVTPRGHLNHFITNAESRESPDINPLKPSG
jgi:hypothetical protein